MLISCVVYNGDREQADIPLEEIPAYLRAPDNFVWVALQDASEDELRAMQKQFGLHDLAVEDVFNAVQRPKVEEYDEHLFVYLQVPA